MLTRALRGECELSFAAVHLYTVSISKGQGIQLSKNTDTEF
jgi:hypothetical protein